MVDWWSPGGFESYMFKYTNSIKQLISKTYTHVKDSNPPKKVGLCTNKVFENMYEINERNKMNVLNVLNVLEKQRRMTGFGRDHSPQTFDSTCEPGRHLEANMEANMYKQNYIHQLKNNRM